jgi:cell division septation protein DedD
LEQANQAAQAYCQRSDYAMVVAGDAAKVGPTLDGIGFELVQLDPRGELLDAAAAGGAAPGAKKAAAKPAAVKPAATPAAKPAATPAAKPAATPAAKPAASPAAPPAPKN